MELLNALRWRYATKQFDPGQKVAPEHLNQILEAVQLSASSYGFQPYKILNIEDPTLRSQLKEASWGQSQVVDASHLLVFCNFNEFTPAMIDEYVDRKATIQNIPLENLSGYRDFMKGAVANKSAEEIKNWNARQTYIALGNLLAACGELNIDSCPMEGFDPAQYDQILGLSAKGLSAVVLATIGYRSPSDTSQSAPKVRKSIADLLETI